MRGIMSRIFSNGPSRDYVDELFAHMLEGSDRANLAAPYFTNSERIVGAAQRGTKIKLLVGLNLSTSPLALRQAHNSVGIEVRYSTTFHAKIYIFDNVALLGSANLTHNGLHANREAVIRLDRKIDKKAIEEMRALFDELWSCGTDLTTSELDAFEEIRRDQLTQRRSAGLSDSHKSIVDALVLARQSETVPSKSTNASNRSKSESRFEKFCNDYQFAFNKVKEIIEAPQFRNPRMKKFHIAHETERFLHYIQKSKRMGVNSERFTLPPMSPDERQENIIRYAKEWANAKTLFLPKNYSTKLTTIEKTYATRNSINRASEKEIVDGLRHLRSFGDHSTQYFMKISHAKFMRTNQDNLAYVKERLSHLLHGSDNFIARIHEVSKKGAPKKLNYLGFFSALELYGTVFPGEFPPICRRTVAILQSLDFDLENPQL